MQLELWIRGPPTRAGRTYEGENAEKQKRCADALQNWPSDKIGRAAVPKGPKRDSVELVTHIAERRNPIEWTNVNRQHAQETARGD